MNSWNLFTWIYTSFNGPFTAAVNAMAASLSGGVEILATVMVTLYLAITFFGDMYSGGGGNPIMDLVRRCGRAALILGCLTGATYAGTIATFLLTTMPADLTSAIAGNNAPVGAAVFDTMKGSVWAAGSQMLGQIGALDLGHLIVIGLAVFICDLLCLVGLGIAFAIWLVTQVSLGLLVAIGPLALLCLILPQTARFFAGWMSAIVTALVAQLLFVALITILIATVQGSLQLMLTAGAANGVNASEIVNQLHLLLGLVVTFLIFGFLSLSIVPIARGIGGGAAAETASISRWAHGQVGDGAAAGGKAAMNAVASLFKGGGGGGGGEGGGNLPKGGAAGMRSITPVGRAIG